MIVGRGEWGGDTQDLPRRTPTEFKLVGQLDSPSRGYFGLGHTLPNVRVGGSDGPMMVNG